MSTKTVIRAQPPKDTMREVSNLVSFIKETAVNNLVMAARTKRITLNEMQLREVTSLVEGSIEEAFFKGSSSIEKSLNR